VVAQVEPFLRLSYSRLHSLARLLARRLGGEEALLDAVFRQDVGSSDKEDSEV